MPEDGWEEYQGNPLAHSISLPHGVDEPCPFCGRPPEEDPNGDLFCRCVFFQSGGYWPVPRAKWNQRPREIALKMELSLKQVEINALKKRLEGLEIRLRLTKSGMV